MTLYTDLLANTSARRIHLVDISGYDPDDTAVETYRYGSETFITASGDTPATTVYYPRVKRALVYNRSMLRVGGQYVGASAPDFGRIILNNDDGGLDFLRDFGFDGRSIVYRLGGDGFTLADFGEVLNGVIASVEFSFGEMIINVRDKKFEMQRKKVSTTVYAGTNAKADESDISFTANNQIDTVGATDFSVFSPSDSIRVMGSASNDGTYTVNTASATQIITNETTIVNESAGASVAIRKKDDVGGDNTIAQKAKPRCLGQVNNITPVLINEGGLIYEIDGYETIEAITAVYDKGVALTLTTDYTVDLTNARFTLLGSPEGEVTCDVKGIKYNGTYINTTVSLVDYLVRELTDLPASSINTSSFLATSSLTSSAIVGMWINPIDIVERSQEHLDTVLDAIDALMGGIGGFSGFNRAGKFTIGRLSAPAVTADAEFDSVTILKIERMPVDLPPYRVRCKYARNWTVQTESQLAGAVTDNRRNYLKEPWLLKEYEDTSLQTKHLLAADWEPIDSYFATEASAGYEAQRIQELYADREMYRVTVKHTALDLDINSTVKITYDRYALSAGKNFRVIEIEENLANSQITMTVWG